MYTNTFRICCLVVLFKLENGFAKNLRTDAVDDDAGDGMSDREIQQLKLITSLNFANIEEAAINSKKINAQWPLGVVPYYLDHSSYDGLVAERVRLAMNSIEESSCVQFKPLLQPMNDGAWIHITNPYRSRECAHETETDTNGTEYEIVMVLGLDCMQRRDILHSMMHALGFKDEITHPQRDQFVRVNWENINPKYRNLFHIDFENFPTSTTEYDPMSIMHFHDRAFTRNGQATIAPLIPGLVINPSRELSPLDKMKLRLTFGHECNRRKVGDLVDVCKAALKDETSSGGKKLNVKEDGQANDEVHGADDNIQGVNENNQGGGGDNNQDDNVNNAGVPDFGDKASVPDGGDNAGVPGGSDNAGPPDGGDTGVVTDIGDNGGIQENPGADAVDPGNEDAAVPYETNNNENDQPQPEAEGGEKAMRKSVNRNLNKLPKRKISIYPSKGNPQKNHMYVSRKKAGKKIYRN